jgi:hypothetical protein
VTSVAEVAYAPVNYSIYTHDELHSANVENVATAKGMNSQFNSFVENRMLLAFRETISRLKKQGHRLNGHSDVEAYFKSIGMTYSNVRQLFSREKKRLLESMGYEKRENRDNPIPRLQKADRKALIEGNHRANELVAALEAGRDVKAEIARFKSVMDVKRLDDIVQANLAEPDAQHPEAGFETPVAVPVAPPIEGDPLPEPDPGTLEELRQRVLRMADVEDIRKALEAYTTELLGPVLATHPQAVGHSVWVRVDRPGTQRIAVGDWLESVGCCGDRLKKLIGHHVGLGRVVSFDQLNRPKVRWHGGQKWSKPYSKFGSDGKVRVLFDWQAAEKYPETFGTYPSDPDPARSVNTTESACPGSVEVACPDDED